MSIHFFTPQRFLCSFSVLPHSHTSRRGLRHSSPPCPTTPHVFRNWVWIVAATQTPSDTKSPHLFLSPLPGLFTALDTVSSWRFLLPGLPDLTSAFWLEPTVSVLFPPSPLCQHQQRFTPCTCTHTSSWHVYMDDSPNAVSSWDSVSSMGYLYLGFPLMPPTQFVTHKPGIYLLTLFPTTPSFSVFKKRHSPCSDSSLKMQLHLCLHLYSTRWSRLSRSCHFWVYPWGLIFCLRPLDSFSESLGMNVPGLGQPSSFICSHSSPNMKLMLNTPESASTAP